MKFIDRFLDGITTYRLTMYYLLFLLATACLLSWAGVLHYDGWRILEFATIASLGSYLINLVIARLWRADLNEESAIITGLIIALIAPIGTSGDWKFVLTATIAAQLSKYLLSVDRSHIFNPAAAGVVIVALIWPHGAATWWIGSKVMALPVLAGGLLLLRKISRYDVVYAFLGTYVVLLALSSWLGSHDINILWNGLKLGFTSSALLFFVFTMLTEPLTMPGSTKLQRAYGVIAAVLYATVPLRLPFALSPELALCVANIFSHFLHANQRFVLKLAEKKMLGSSIWEFSFDRPKDFRFVAGQFMEWTLPHRASDNRGNRRYFTVASSPRESKLRLVVKFPPNNSSYKTQLLKMEPGDQITAGSLEGNFVLPSDTSKPLVFLAGGVGIAPFRSFVADMILKKQSRDVVLIYSSNRADELAYKKLFSQAEPLGLRTVYCLSDLEHLPSNWQGGKGFVTSELLRRQVPDFAKRQFYLSGPQAMIMAMEETLAQMSLPRSQVVTDYFPGYA